MAFDAYLQLEDLEGEAETAGFEGQIEIYSFNFTGMNSASMATQGMGTGKATVSSFNVMKVTDTTSPVIFQNCMQGVHWPTATVTLLKTGGMGEPLPFLVFEFKELYCSSISWSGGAGGDDAPMESLAFDFSAIKITYTQQDEKGTGSKKPVGSWDLRTQTINF
jgi:type VI secretion system secreted protein Hcp